MVSSKSGILSHRFPSVVLNFTFWAPVNLYLVWVMSQGGIEGTLEEEPPKEPKELKGLGKGGNRTVGFEGIHRNEGLRTFELR